jgi:hypothetical protein
VSGGRLSTGNGTEQGHLLIDVPGQRQVFSWMTYALLNILSVINSSKF